MLLQNLFLGSQAPLGEPGTEMGRGGSQVPGSCVAQVDISSPEVSSPFSHSQQPIARGEWERKNEIKHLPTTPGMIYAWRGGCGCQNCKGQRVLPILIFPW